MKKLSILVALILCVTIGGVYATWTYAGSNDVFDANTEIVVVLEQATQSGSIGTFSAESNFTLSIDQGDANHNAKLVFKPTNSDPIHVTFTFTPSDGADGDIKSNAIPAEVYLATTTTMEYKMDASGNYSATGTSTPIFKLFNPSNGNFDANVTWESQPDGSFKATYNEAALKDMIQLYTTFRLDTKTEYDEFAKVLTGNIKICITDGTVNSGSAG